MWKCHKMVREGNIIYEENIVKNYLELRKRTSMKIITLRKKVAILLLKKLEINKNGQIDILKQKIIVTYTWE